MRSFHKDGRVRVILKLRLPRTDGNTDENSEFNAFYERLAEEYMRSVEEVSYSTDVGARPTTVSVDFSVCTEEYIKKHPKLSKKLEICTVIKRETKINNGRRVRKTENTDVYNERTFTFIK